MTCAFVQAPALSRHTLSVSPATANASVSPPASASAAVRVGTAGSGRHVPPGPLMTAARPPPSSTHALPFEPNPDATGDPATAPDTVQDGPCQAAYTALPDASRAVLPLSRGTRTWPPPGTDGPSSCHVPLVSVKTPATPRRSQAPATTFRPFGQNDKASTPVTPHSRPALDAASAGSDVSLDHEPPAPLTSTSPFRSSASSAPEDPVASASGTLASAAPRTL